MKKGPDGWQQALKNRYSQMTIAHQGQLPEKASVVILGLDANWSPELGEHPAICQLIFEYLDDGVGFWRKHGCHHPFMLKSYKETGLRDGVHYHRQFSKLGLTPAHAPHVSFAELLNVPTSGRLEEKEFLNHFKDARVRAHAERLETFLIGGERRLVVVSGSVVRRMQRLIRLHGLFKGLVRHLPEVPHDALDAPTHALGNTEFIRARHFSAAQKNERLEALGRRLRTFIEGGA